MKPPRTILVSIALGLLGLLTAASQAHAQTALASPTLYRLDRGSTYQSGCFEPCLCPMLEQATVRGTLRLAPAGSDWLYDSYKVSEVNWTVAFGNSELRITGSGTYIIGGEFARVHRLELDLAVGDEPVQHFDSGLIPSSAAFPAIDVAVSIHGQYCFDTVIHVVMAPVPLDQIHLYKLQSDTTFQRGCFGFCDCLLGEELPVTGTFNLVDLDPTAKFREFAVVDVRWWVGAADATALARLPIRGYGTYRIGVESSSVHQLALDLYVGREPLTRYDSGLVVPITRFPRIDADISIGGLTCYDTLIQVHAMPRHRGWARIAPEVGAADPVVEVVE